MSFATVSRAMLARACSSRVPVRLFAGPMNPGRVPRGLSLALLAGAITVAAPPAADPVKAGGDGVTPAQAVLRTDTVSRVARARLRSVVFLHMVLQRVDEPRISTEGVLPGLWAGPAVATEGLGTGVVIDPSGLILTNDHLVDGAAVIHVRTAGGDDIEATVVGRDPETDLALLRVAEATGLEPAPLGDSDRVGVGDWVIAIGNPFGLHHTVTIGIISGRGRRLDGSGVEYLQTDAAVNPGSSGGPLLDLTGGVIGIVTKLVSGMGESVGLNFAIPINTAKELLPQLRSGWVVHGWIGFEALRLTPSGARALGLQPPAGLLVTNVPPGGPAAQAGVRTADVILGIAGERPVPPDDVEHHVMRARPGTTVNLLVFRNGQAIEVPVVVAARPRLRGPER